MILVHNLAKKDQKIKDLETNQKGLPHPLINKDLTLFLMISQNI